MTEPLASVHAEALMPGPSVHTCLPAIKNTFLLFKITFLLGKGEKHRHK